jgi:probable phosphoglycerate mutase
MHLLFVRHGQSTGNQAGRMLGHSSDPLSPQGEQQVQALGHGLVEDGYRPTVLYSSPLPRARQTAQILHHWLYPEAAPDVPAITYDDRLCEFQNGIFQGLTWAEAQAQYPDLCQRLTTQLDWIPIPGAETLQDGRDRATQFITMLYRRHGPGDRLCIVTHHWILQQLVSVVLGSDRTWGFAADYTARFEFRLALPLPQASDANCWNSDLWQIQRFGDRRHLDRLPTAER